MHSGVEKRRMLPGGAARAASRYSRCIAEEGRVKLPEKQTRRLSLFGRRPPHLSGEGAREIP
ncbi:hypothetical protein MASR2M79_10400 [Aminivibrio sp.]